MRLVCAFLLSSSILTAWELLPATGPGEDLDLETGAGLFKNPEDLQNFEKRIHVEENEINNLDLN
ncbi:MAG: hypothetical protein MI975_10195 [Cytophagales bacterium]|nr:hypothetical protein [Cytophagales bacterium]